MEAEIASVIIQRAIFRRSADNSVPLPKAVEDNMVSRTS